MAQITELKEFFDPMAASEREKTAESLGTKWVYISQIIRKHRRASTELSQKLHALSPGTIPLHCLRPDVWAA